jgi:hypothetical protein
MILRNRPNDECQEQESEQASDYRQAASAQSFSPSVRGTRHRTGLILYGTLKLGIWPSAQRAVLNDAHSIYFSDEKPHKRSFSGGE